jgi:excisionase family DNA binding protein
MSHPDEPLWTSDDVARFLAVSRSWVEHNAPRGVIPSVKIGRMRRFVPSEIRAFAGTDVPTKRTKGRRRDG